MSESVIERIGRSVDDFREQMRVCAEALARIDWPQLQRALDQIDGYDAHHPRPLAINGREYARRRRNR